MTLTEHIQRVVDQAKIMESFGARLIDQAYDSIGGSPAKSYIIVDGEFSCLSTKNGFTKAELHAIQECLDHSLRVIFKHRIAACIKLVNELSEVRAL